MGCDPEKFAFNEVARIDLRKKWDIPPKGIVFIFIGRVLKAKGIFELLEAFCLLTKKLPDAYLIFVGEGKDKKNLVKKAVRIGISNRVIFIGRRPQEELPHWLSMSDILMLPSYSEGLPNVVAEAMACQRPVIATKVGGIPEIIADGKSGILVEPKDSVTLADAMQRVARDKDLRFRMGDLGRKIVIEKFSWDENIRKIINLYNSIIR
jgi:glycosyltransferase involved in cell wall biosynthesis